MYVFMYVYTLTYVCSTDRERMGQVKEEMKRLLVNIELQTAVFLVLANKQVSLSLSLSIYIYSLKPKVKA